MNRSFSACSKPRPRCWADSPRRFPTMNGKTRRPGNRSARTIMVEHDRRTALGLVAGAGLASALILPACAQSSNSNESSTDLKSTRLNSSHKYASRMTSSALKQKKHKIEHKRLTYIEHN